MKKIYMMPATAVVKIETAQMMVTSPNSNPEGFEGGLGGEGGDGGDGLSRRRGSIWDDEE